METARRKKKRPYRCMVIWGKKEKNNLGEEEEKEKEERVRL
jgi:hypothetical protein